MSPGPFIISPIDIVCPPRCFSWPGSAGCWAAALAASANASGEELLRAVSHAIEKAGRGWGAEPERVMVGAEQWFAKAAAATGGAAESRPERADHNRAEEQLRLLKPAIEQSNESVMIMTAQLDPPGPRIVYVNSAFTKMTGYAREEVIGKTSRILDGPKTDRAALDRLRKDCAAGKVFHGEIIQYRKNGSEFHLEWTVGPVRNERGEVTHIVANQRDVTLVRLLSGTAPAVGVIEQIRAAAITVPHVL